MPCWRFCAFGSVHQAEAPIGHVRGRGPDLLAVDDVFVADPLCRGLERGEVGAGAGLGKALTPPIVEIGGARQEALFLLLGAELHQHRADHRDVEALHVRRRRELVLFEEHHALDRRPTRTAPLLGPAIGGPIARVEDALPADRVFLFRSIAEPHLVADVGRQVIADETAHLIAKRQFLGAEAKIHCAALPVVCAQAVYTERPLEPRGQGC